MSTRAQTIARLEAEGRVIEFRDCGRCGIELTPDSEAKNCGDCGGVVNFKERRTGGILDPVEPAYEVSLHYGGLFRHCTTLATLDALRIPRMTYTKNNPVELEYARSLIGGDFEPDWPIVLITSHGEVIDQWTGFDLVKLNNIPAARAAAAGTTTEVSTTESELIAA